MFYIMLRKLIPLFQNVTTFSWNYSEAGHSKGAPDGVGAMLKRTCDRIVAQNKDICNFSQFSANVIEQIKKIEIISVDPKSDEDGDDLKLFSEPIKGTLDIFHLI